MCEEQRGHRGRKTHKQRKKAVGEIFVLEWAQYYASKDDSVLV